MKAGFLLIFLGCISVYSQDPNWAIEQNIQASQNAALAAQQAMDQMQQASDQAMILAQQNAQMFNQQMLNQMMQSNETGWSACNPTVCITRPPVFSIKSGAVSPGKKLHIRSFTHDVFIYYTTDGSTPTAKSLRYRGSVVIKSSMQLKAIAIAPGMAPSPIAVAKFTVQAPPSSPVHGPGPA